MQFVSLSAMLIYFSPFVCVFRWCPVNANTSFHDFKQPRKAVTVTLHKTEVRRLFGSPRKPLRRIRRRLPLA
ncbi:hypothetical protein DL95DRAFT_392984 [Leptodontidium sp. 2 PMI_412]|nr:hypothetical protein BKA61DRAFT_620078 [Leptodontidium sp. MPI-SDFR-AT-0119]KAH9210877.1 hypothetical protein DL95DRAFT_392984 [Leptodontidium sp. 2 PMI_412]